MQLPDEAIVYQYQNLLVPPADPWGPAAQLRARHFLQAARLKAIAPQLLQVRSQVAVERDLKQVPPELQPLDAGFIDLPQQTLEQYRRKAESSPLGRVLMIAARLREQVDRVVVVGLGGASLAVQALMGALCSRYHNELAPQARQNRPRMYFEGDAFDNDSLQDLLDLLQSACVDPEIRDERWGAIVVNPSGDTLESSVAYRVVRREAREFYGAHSARRREFIVPVTGSAGRFRDLCRAEEYGHDEILTLPDRVGGHFSLCTAAGLLPAAVLGLDVRALLLGAQAMTQRFFDEPFERNPVLQYAAVNYLMNEEIGKSGRVLAVWSKKLEGLANWYDHLLTSSLGKRGRGPTPLLAVHTRDLQSRSQHQLEGPADKVITNLLVRTPKAAPIAIGMADRNEDALNAVSRKTLPDLNDTALRGMNRACFEFARPTAELVLPSLSEHTMGQLMQMMMLATVVEARLLGINPYGQPSVDAFRNALQATEGGAG